MKIGDVYKSISLARYSAVWVETYTLSTLAIQVFYTNNIVLYEERVVLCIGVDR